MDGDFIVPIDSAHLEGALNINLEGAFHSPLGSKVSFLGPWYGSEQVGFFGYNSISPQLVHTDTTLLHQSKFYSNVGFLSRSSCHNGLSMLVYRRQ